MRETGLVRPSLTATSEHISNSYDCIESYLFEFLNAGFRSHFTYVKVMEIFESIYLHLERSEIRNQKSQKTALVCV